MQIYINGKIKQEQDLNMIIGEALRGLGDRIGVPEDTEIALTELQFKVVFNINGQEQYATVPREVNGETVNELFAVSIHLDEEGNIIQREDNEEESFYDPYTLAKANGQEYQYEGIESKYKNKDLEIIDSIGEPEPNEPMAVKYSIKGTDRKLVRHYKGEKLVAEYELDGEPEEKEE